MTQPEQVLAGILTRGARALAGYAAGETLDVDGEQAQLASGSEFTGWQTLLAVRLEELAVAISTGNPDYFIEQVRWTRTMLEARGVPADLLRTKLANLRGVLVEQLSPGLSPLATNCLDRALAEFDGAPAGLTPRLTAETPDGELAAKYLVAVLEGDRRKASRLILQAAEEGRTATDLSFKVLQPAQEELGRMWVLGEVNVAEEHFATATTRLVAAQLHAREECGPSNGKTIVAASVAGNQHDLGIQLIADLFERDGWRVIQLGSNVPVEDLAESVEFFQADLVAISVSLATQLPMLKEAVAAIRAGGRGGIVKVLVGGNGIMSDSETSLSLDADGFATNGNEALMIGRELVGLGPTST
jgi:MerR family transcriptional regulator, light-induced transcriptional regulator